MPERSRGPRFVPLAALLVLAAGCEGQPRKTAQTKAKVQAREIIGKTTQEVLPLEPELEKGAQVASTQITATDPISLPGNATVATTGKIAMQEVGRAIEFYNASNGAYPKDYQEFMDGVIKPGKPDGLQLPQLPAYQGYGYDAQNHKLIVLEYPERKEELKRQFQEKLHP